MKPNIYTITLLRKQMETLIQVLETADRNATTLANVLDDLDGYAAECKSVTQHAVPGRLAAGRECVTKQPVTHSDGSGQLDPRQKCVTKPPTAIPWVI